MAFLELHALKKAYRAPDGEVTPVIDIPSFSLEKGEQLALRGASGSGKTTLLNLIAGILQADSGRIAIDGREMTTKSESVRDRLRAEAIGFVFQTFNLLQGFSALENVMIGMMFGRGADRAQAEHLLDRVGLAKRLHYKPRQLSVGQQQRVAVARALANRPRLVLADEPTGNLDRHHAREALGLIRDICYEQGATLLLVSHDPDVLAQFDRQRDLAELNLAAQITPLAAAEGAVA
jgi:ABC-type lipoprotein export system ATPase subunit